MKSTLTIRLPERDRKVLEEISRESHMRLSDVARDAIRWYIVLCEFHRACDIVRPYAQARGIFTDEDVFKIVS